MEIDVTYVAKDGRRFTDALKCQDYEKTIGIIPGSVGDFICQLEQMPQEHFISGSVMVRTKTGKGMSFQNFVSRAMDDDIEESDPLFSEKAITTTVAQAIEAISHLYDRDFPIQDICMVCEKVQSGTGVIMANINRDLFNNASNGK